MFKRLLKIDPSLSHSVFIFGPRGTGKTSWLKEHFSDALYFDLLNSDIYTELLARPTRLASLIPDDYMNWVILDEVQRIPALLDEVHRLIEHRKLRFILTGSSARSLKRKGVNLLAGRALTYHMHPLTTIELGSAFDLAYSLQYGTLPAVINHENPERYLSTYVKTYLREEVLQESLTRNLNLFTRFLEVASFSQGSVISYSEIAREVGSSRHTIANFFDILEDLLIAYRLPVFTKRAKRDVISHPKFYYFDVGIYRTIRPVGPLDSPAEAEGPALETLFLQEVKALNDYFNWGYEIFYWRTKNGLEIDFILYGPRGLHAFEIKRKAQLNTKDFHALKEFKKDYPIVKTYLLYGGENNYHDSGVEVRSFTKTLFCLPQLL